MSNQEVSSSAIGNVYFYNMTSQDIQISLNDPINTFTINAIPNTTPYTPNVSTAIQRYNGTPQAKQFGTTNKLTYYFSGEATDAISLTINVNFRPYPIQYDILVYLFYNSAVVTVVTDNNAYLGKNGDVITVDPSNALQKI